MIPITKQKEPLNFNDDVRKPGVQFLQENNNPSSREFKKHNYWKKISPHLYELYNGICAYTGMWFHCSHKSVDHFIPKSKSPQLAYEWDNYRLTTNKMNADKSDKSDIIDPFEVKLGWFVLDMQNYQIKPSLDVEDFTRDKIKHTIDVLKLNSDDERVERRRSIIQDYLEGNFDFEFLKNKFPYIAYEIERHERTKQKTP